jgi:hypothetical protein
LDDIFKQKNLPLLTASVLIFGAVFLLFHDLFYGKILATNDIGSNDLLFFYLPIKKLYADALRNGELLQWTPLIYGGFPVFAEGQGGFLYPLNLVIWYLLTPVGAMNFYILFHALLMGFGVYFLTSLLTGNKIFSIPAGVAASICGSVIAGHTRHLNSLTAIVYAPWLFYTVELFLCTRKVSKGLVFGILLGLLLLGGHPQHTFISASLAVLYLFLRIVFEKKSESFINRIKNHKALQFLLLAMVVFVMIGLPQIKSTMELVPFTERSQELTSEFIGNGSLPFKGFLTFIYPYYMGNIGNDTFQDVSGFYFWEFFCYSGAVIFFLAITGTIKMWKRPEYYSIIRSLVIIAIISYLIALGENLQLYKIFTLFPIIKSFRIPARWLAGTELSILVLSGFGVIWLAEFFSRKTNTSEKRSVKKAKTEQAVKEVNIPAARQYKTAVIISVIAAFEIFFVAGRQVVTSDKGAYLDPPSYVSKILEANKPVTNARVYPISWYEYMLSAFQKSHGWEGKQDLFQIGAKQLPPELGAYFGVPSMNGYLVLIPTYIYEVWSDSKNRGIIGNTATIRTDGIFKPTDKFFKLTKMFGVKYMTSAWTIPKPYELFWDSLGIKAYERKDTVLRAWVVPKVQVFSSDNSKINAPYLITDSFDPQAFAYVEGPVPELPAGSTGGTAEILKEDNHSVIIKANSPGFVVINDTWYPRWKAFIDGAEVPVYKTNVMMRGVIAPKAGTIIEMKFDKGNVFIFSVLSYLVIFGCIGYLVVEKIKERKRTPPV